MVFREKNSDMFLFNKTKYFGLKKYQICFKNLEKVVLVYKRPDLFLYVQKV